MPLTLRQPIATPPTSPTFCAGRQLSEFEQRQWWPWRQDEPQPASRWLRERLSPGSPGRTVSVRHLNRLRAGWGLSRRRGRPRGRASAVPGGEGERIEFAPRLSFVGVHLLGHWLAQQGSWTEVLEPLEAAIAAYRQTHPEEDFPL